jgi:hypothetical protein
MAVSRVVSDRIRLVVTEQEMPYATMPTATMSVSTVAVSFMPWLLTGAGHSINPESAADSTMQIPPFGASTAPRPTVDTDTAMSLACEGAVNAALPVSATDNMSSVIELEGEV